MNGAVFVTIGAGAGFIAGVLIGVSGTIAIAAVRPWKARP